MRILLTGAAGLIGGELAARLVAAGHEVTALVHRNREIRSNDGELVPVAGVHGCDIAEPLLGFAPDRARALADAHELVIHCAATVRFDLADEEYRHTNTHGTANVIELARLGDCGLLYVSTAYVCGTRGGTIREDDPLPGKGFANGYERSKAEAELLVRNSGLDWAIVRPSIVTGDSRTGAIRQFDTIYAAFKLIAEGRVRQMEASKDATLDFVPIDHVACGLAALVEQWEDVSGATFHLVSGAPVSVQGFADAIGGYEQFSQPELVSPETFDPAGLPPLERRLYGRIAGLYASYFQRNPRFDDSEFRALTGLQSRPTDADYLRTLIDYCIGAGFLSGAAAKDGVSAHPDNARPVVRARRAPTGCRP